MIIKSSMVHGSASSWFGKLTMTRTPVVTLSVPKGWFDKLTMTWTAVVTLSVPKGDK